MKKLKLEGDNKRMINEINNGTNPLLSIPNYELRLYVIDENFFETKKELEKYCKSNSLSIDNAYFLDYIRNMAGRDDVIRKSNFDGKSLFYTVVDEDGYGIYNNERSSYCGRFIWEFNYGDIREMYEPFRKKGVVFEDDIYFKIDEREQRILKKIKEKRYFNS